MAFFNKLARRTPSAWQERNRRWLKAHPKEFSVAWGLITGLFYFAIQFAFFNHEKMSFRISSAVVFGVLMALVQYFVITRRRNPWSGGTK